MFKERKPVEGAIIEPGPPSNTLVRCKIRTLYGRGQGQAAVLDPGITTALALPNLSRSAKPRINRVHSTTASWSLSLNHSSSFKSLSSLAFMAVSDRCTVPPGMSDHIRCVNLRMPVVIGEAPGAPTFDASTSPTMTMGIS